MKTGAERLVAEMFELIGSNPWDRIIDEDKPKIIAAAQRLGIEDVDDPEPMTAVEKVRPILATLEPTSYRPRTDSIDRLSRETIDALSAEIVRECNIHDELPDGELLPCPECEAPLTVALDDTTAVVLCDQMGAAQDCFRLEIPNIPQQQAINAANALIRELGK